MKYYIGVALILLLTGLTLGSGIDNTKQGLNRITNEQTTKIDMPASSVDKSEIICVLGKNVRCAQHITFQAMHFVSND